MKLDYFLTFYNKGAKLNEIKNLSDFLVEHSATDVILAPADFLILTTNIIHLIINTGKAMANGGDVSLLSLAFHRATSPSSSLFLLINHISSISLQLGIINTNKTVHYFHALENPSKVLVVDIKKFHYHTAGPIC